MARFPLNDVRLFEIVSSYTEASHRIVRLLERIASLKGSARYEAFRELQEILSELEDETAYWAEENIREFVEEADSDARSALIALGAAAVFEEAFADESIRALVADVTGTLGKGREAVELLSMRVLRSDSIADSFPDLAMTARRELLKTAEAAELSVEAVQARTASLFGQRLDSGTVELIASNGRKIRFPLDFYAGMVVQNARSQAQSMATILRAREAQHDLVQVSLNPSTVGDWCDAYVGHVFSISGADPRFPSLASAPGGGPPFHPWCRHYLMIFDDEEMKQEELRALADVDERFLMAPGETDTNRIAREWRRG